jgi:glycerol-3-phosphate acyltransferase PlsY
MATNFHETYREGEIKPPSERSTGLLFSAIAAIVAALWHNVPPVLWGGLGVAAIMALISLIAPMLLRPLNHLWFQFGLVLHRIVSPVIMLVLFLVVFLPAGAIMRLWRDPLKKQRTPKASTYWIERKSDGHSEGSMRNQF